jgi:hypothetical protein
MFIDCLIDSNTLYPKREWRFCAWTALDAHIDQGAQVRQSYQLESAPALHPVEPLWTKHIVDHFDVERPSLVAFDSREKAT